MAAKTADGTTLLPETKRLAEGKNFAAVTTQLPSGRMQTQMIWVHVDGDRLVLNTETHRTKYDNIAGNSTITVMIRNEEDPYCYAEVRGHVSATQRGDRAREHVDELAYKYLDKPYPPEAIKSERVMLWITAERQTFIDQNNGVAD